MNGVADGRTLALYGVLAAIISLGLLIFAYFGEAEYHGGLKWNGTAWVLR